MRLYLVYLTLNIIFSVVVVFYLKSHTYSYSVIGQRALISPKLETQTIIFGTEGSEYLLCWTIEWTNQVINSHVSVL